VEAKLVVVGGESQVLQYELELPVVIGRSRSTDVTLGHPLVSRHHCEVFEANGVLMVRDLGSLNGTYVGETRITEQPAPVRPGELITVGPVTFRAVYRAADRRLNAGGWEAQGPTIDAPLPNQLDPLGDTAVRPDRPGNSDL
jgi:predicted component of type VI protein secretion system